MRFWPWFTIVLAVLLALSPPGLDLFHGAFLAGEQLTRNIARPLYLTAVGVAVGVALIEWIARRRLYRPRRATPKEPT